MTTDRRLLGAVFGLALFVAACGGSSSGSPAATSGTGGTASQAPAATDAAATADSGTGVTGGNPAAASDLEALIPDKVGSGTMQKSSVDFNGLGLAGIPFDKTKIGPFLGSKGKTADDVSVAMAVSSAGKPMMYVVRVKGVPASDYGPELFGQVTNGMDKKTIGGKDVYWTGAAGYTTAVYLKDDKLVYILMASEDEASQILSAMP